MRKTLCVGVAVASWMVSHEVNAWCKRKFPPEAISPLPPEERYYVVGHMGCSDAVIDAIRQRKRLLFFASGDLSLEVAQRYAVCRTPFWDRLRERQKPVVLQLEARKDFPVRDEELWRDPNLQRIHPTTSLYLSFWPAITPESQKRSDLRVRVHHYVTTENRINGAAFYRALLSVIRTWQQTPLGIECKRLLVNLARPIFPFRPKGGALKP